VWAICGGGPWPPSGKTPETHRGDEATIDAIRVGTHYATTYGTLWKDGTYFPRGTRVLVVGLHLDQGFCVRFPAEVDGEPLETWEDWSESDFLAADGTIESTPALSASVLAEAREVLDDAEDGCHLHLHETED
jgi:cytosine/adenosine deaminase-related metal-dependent hydrolase